MLIRAVFIITFAASVAFADIVKFKDCGSKVGEIVNVNVTPCATFPCPLYKGENTTVGIKFTSKELANVTKAVVHGILAGVPVPFPLSNPDGCKDSGLVCPLKTSAAYEYTSTLPVSEKYPELKLVVKWELQDDHNNDLFCFEVPVKIEKRK